MLRSSLFLICLFTAFDHAPAQSWCPPGAQWHVTRSGFMMQGYIHYVFVGDTFIYGRTAQKISQNGYEFTTYPDQQQYIISGFTYTALEDDVLLVPVWYPPPNSYVWDTLIWFGANVGDRWYSPGDDGTLCGPPPGGMFEVTSTTTTMIDGISLRTLQIAGVDSTGDLTGPEYIFTERLGVAFNHFMAPCVFDGPGWGTIRCYSDDEIFYVAPFWNGPCDMGLFIEDRGLIQIQLHPNPGTDHFTLEIPPGPHQLILFDTQGRQVLRQQLSEERPVISTTSLPSGIYHIHITDSHGRSSGLRWVKQ